jgi:hypothetical protein
VLVVAAAAQVRMEMQTGLAHITLQLIARRACMVSPVEHVEVETVETAPLQIRIFPVHVHTTLKILVVRVIQETVAGLEAVALAAFKIRFIRILLLVLVMLQTGAVEGAEAMPEEVETQAPPEMQETPEAREIRVVPQLQQRIIVCL